MDDITYSSFFSLVSDKPLTHPSEDQLGYADFAKMLANIITSTVCPEGLVIALYGPWGSGKTSVLNFIEFSLRDVSHNASPIVMRFSPWWFSDHNALVRYFFDQLQSTIARDKTRIKKLKERLAQLADLVSDVPISYAKIGKVLSRSLREPEKDVPTLKREIAELLSSLGRHVLIIVDDIDRMTSEEIRHFFRVIKAVADFPNVIYLLAFDERIVVKALEKEYAVSGKSYLEKIVQVPITMPAPEREDLKRFLYSRLDQVLRDTPDDLFDSKYWDTVYSSGLGCLFSTPRDVIRVTSVLNMTYRSVVGEVNPVDFIAIETLRVLFPDIYAVIRDNPSYFTGCWKGNNRFYIYDDEKLKMFHNTWLSQIKIPNELIQLLKKLFPRLEMILDDIQDKGMVSWDEQYSEWRRQLRACSPDLIELYFRWRLPPDAISNHEIKLALQMAETGIRFREKLLEFGNQLKKDNRTRFEDFIDRLGDYIDYQITDNMIPVIITTLFDIGDQLLKPEEDARWRLKEFGSELKIMSVIWRLLRRYTEPKRFEILETAMREGQSVYIAVFAMILLGQQHGKYRARLYEPQGQLVVDKDHLEALEELVLEKIEKAAMEDQLICVPHLFTVLELWRELRGDAHVNTWVKDVLARSDDYLVRMLESFLSVYLVQSGWEYLWTYVTQPEKRGTLKDPKQKDLAKKLEPYFSVSDIMDRVHSLLQNDSYWTGKQKYALEVFSQCGSSDKTEKDEQFLR